MAGDFRSARYWASEMIEPALYEGATAIDATMGNGHDTEWLCRLVGHSGHVYAFDVQQAAVDRTRERLEKAGLADVATLFCAGHETMSEHVDARADVIVFNLGWLPGAAHGVTTKVETTLEAVRAGMMLLKPEGLMTICVYPGHDEGTREREALYEFIAKLDPAKWDALSKRYLNQPNFPPELIAIRRRRTKQDPAL